MLLTRVYLLRFFNVFDFSFTTIMLLQSIKTLSILGAGWLGQSLGQILVQKGYQVKGSTTRKEKFPTLQAAGITPYHLKISGNQIIAEQELEDFFTCDILFVNLPPGRRNPEVEFEFPERIKTIMILAQTSEIPHAIFVSSTGVFGSHQTIVNEDDIPEPSTASGRALLTTERYLSLLNSPKTTILRFGGLIGPNRHPGRFLAGKQNLKDGASPVNMTHLDDAVGASISIMEHEKWGDIFHVVADQHPLRKDYYPAMAEAIHLSPPSFLSDNNPSGKIVSSERIKRELGYTFLKPDPSII